MLSMGHMDYMRVCIVSFESLDEGLSSLEAVFNVGQVPGFRFVSCFSSRLSQHDERPAYFLVNGVRECFS